MKAFGQLILKYHVRTVIIATIVINALIVLLSLLPSYVGKLPAWIAFLPTLNAILNSFTFVFLLLALASILRRNIRFHRIFILCAFTTTTIFLFSYVIFHFSAESTPYGGTGLTATLYYFILISHIILAAAIVPLALMSLFTGLKDLRVTHKKWVHWTMPLWLYVSFTGVLVYLMISPYYSF